MPSSGLNQRPVQADLHSVLAGRNSLEDSPSRLLRTALGEVLEVTGAPSGLLAVLDVSESFLKPLARVVSGRLPCSAERLLRVWRDNPARQETLSVGSGSFWMHSLWDGAQLAGLLALEEPFQAGQLGRTKDNLDLLLVAVYRQVLRQRVVEWGDNLDIVGASPAFLRLERRIRAAAAHSQASVLITGPRGCGKELAAKAIHFWSSRRLKPFIPLLASALPESLFADELFGHEQYAFTDARSRRKGHFEAAEGGTLFLDEVGDLPLSIQAALLRVLEGRELARIGSSQRLRVDVRVVAATNKNLDQIVHEGGFRADLFDRLSVFEIRVPCLDKRQEDVTLLASFFLRMHCALPRRIYLDSKLGECHRCAQTPASCCATEGFFEALQDQSWPGNIRQLRNFITRVVAHNPCQILDSRHVNGLRPSDARRKDWRLDSAVRAHLARVLQETDGNQSRAARMLGIPLSTLRSKLKKLSLC